MRECLPSEACKVEERCCVLRVLRVSAERIDASRHVTFEFPP